jgi:hypothetical protein
MVWAPAIQSLVGVWQKVMELEELQQQEGVRVWKVVVGVNYLAAQMQLAASRVRIPLEISNGKQGPLRTWITLPL